MPYLFAAFCAVWLGLFLYLSFLSRRQSALAREVESLRHLLEKKTARE
jgi:CcmD family protein